MATRNSGGFGNCGSYGMPTDVPPTGRSDARRRAIGLQRQGVGQVTDATGAAINGAGVVRLTRDHSRIDGGALRLVHLAAGVSAVRPYRCHVSGGIPLALSRLPREPRESEGPVSWKRLVASCSVWALGLQWFCHYYGFYFCITWLPQYL